MKTFFFYKRIILIIFIFCIFFKSQLIQATEINIIPLQWEAGINQNLEINISLTVGEESINAISGEIIFPEELLEFKDIKDGNSIINFWIEKPHLKERNKIVFAGMIPGGFSNNNGLLFSLIFKTKKEGNGVIELRNVESFLNDGIGTPASLKLFQLAFTIHKTGKLKQPTSLDDKELPENFYPEITREESMFNGKWFLVFTTQDKKSGIDHYEIFETRSFFIQKIHHLFFSNFSKTNILAKFWEKTESPYLLKDQHLKSYILIKAIDRAGNQRIVVVKPKYPIPWYQSPESWFIILLLGILFFLGKKILWSII